MLDNQALEKIVDVVTSKDFYKLAHRDIYEHIEKLIAHDTEADVVTVSESMESAGILERIGGPAYLGALAQNTPSALNIRRYAELVKEKATARNLLTITSDIGERVYSGNGSDIAALLEEAEGRIFQLRERRTMKKPTTFPQILAKVYESIDTRYHAVGSREITGIATGFTKMDEMTAGLQRGELVIVAGRPSMGKTAFAMNVAEYAVLEKKLPVAVFSIEMTDEALVQRLLGSVGSVDQHKLKTGQLHDGDWKALSAAMERLHDAPLIVEESTGLLIIDYLQLMVTHAKTQSERTSEVGDISRGLKALAKELDIPVMALSQLNRGVDARPNRRPLMSDLRDSGSIEQDADLIVFMYRDEVYTEDTPWRGYAEVIIGKQRNGPTGTVNLQFVKEWTRFQNPAFGWLPPTKGKGKKKSAAFDPAADDETRKRADIDS